MPISFVAAGTVATGANPTVTVPAGIAQNDLLVIITTGTATPVTPSGWTQRGAQGAAGNLTILYKFAGPTEASVSLTLSGTTSKSVMMAYRGVAATDSISTFTTATGTSLATSTLTTAIVNEYVISVYGANGGAATTWTAPASTTARVTSSSTSTLTGLLIVDEQQASAGTSTARTATVSASRTLSAVQFAITSNDRFWVGGSGTWDNSSTTNWSYTSGGASGAPAPTTSDIANFDANSGTAATVTVASTAAAFSTNINKSDINLSLSGNATLATNLGSLTFTAGAITLNNNTLSCGSFISDNANARSISFGSGSIALTGATATTTVLSMSNATNFTWTGTGGFTRNMAVSATVVFGVTGGSTTNAPNLTVNAGGAPLTITVNSWLNNVNFTGSTSTVTAAGVNISGNLTLASGGTYTGVVVGFVDSGTVTSNGKTLGNTLVDGAGITVTLADAMTIGATGTFTLSQGTLDLAGFTLSTGIFSSSNTSTRSIAFGSGNIALTSNTASTTILSMATTTGFTWTGTGGFTRNQTATATITFGGTATNAPNFSVTTGASALTITNGTWLDTVNFTGSTCTVTSGATFNIAGDLTLATGGTYTAVTPTFVGSSTVISNGKTLGNTTINGSGITVTLGDAMTLATTSTFTLTQGALNLNGFTLSAGIFSSANSNTRSIAFGSSNIALTNTVAGTTILVMGTIVGFSWTGTGGFTRNQAATATVTYGSSSGGGSGQGVNLFVNAGASALTITTATYLTKLDCTGSTCSVICSTLNLSGDLTLATGGTYTSLVPIFLTSGTVTNNGKTLGNTTVSGSGITVTLADSMTLGTGSTFTLTQGTIDLAGFTLTTGVFSSSNTNTRSIAFGSGNIVLNSNTIGATILSVAIATGFSWTGTGGFTRNQATTATITFGSTTGGSATNAPNIAINGGASALTITAGSWVENLDFTGSTCNASGSFNISGNLTLASLINYSITPTFVASSTVTSVGGSIGATTVNGSGITVTLADNMGTGAFTLTQGTLALGTNTLTTPSFSSSGTSTRSVTFGSGSKVQMTGNSATVLNFSIISNLSFTGTPLFQSTYTGSTGTRTFSVASGSFTLDVSTAGSAGIVLGTTATDTVALSGTFGNVDLTGFTATLANNARTITGNLTLPASGGTFTAGTSTTTFAGTGTITSNGTTLDFPITINSPSGTVTLADALTVGSTRTFTLTQGTLNLGTNKLSTGIFSSSNSNTRSVTFGSGSKIELTGNNATVLDFSASFSFTTTGTVWFDSVYTGGTGTRDFAMVSSVGDGPILDVKTSGTSGIVIGTTATDTVALRGRYASLDFTGFTNTLANSSRTITGNLTLPASGGTFTAGTSTTTFAGTGTITSNGRTIDWPIAISTSGTITLADALTLGSTRTFTLTQGTFNAVTYNVSCGLFSSSNTNTRTLALGSGTWTIQSGSSTTGWDCSTSTNLTVTGSGTISMASASAKAFAGGGLTWPILNNGGAGALTISGDNTFTTLSNSVQPTTFTFTAGSSQTVTNFNVNGTSGNLVTINSSSAGSQATLSKASGTVSVLYLSITDSNATGGATWQAFTSNGNVDGGNNTGWDFGAILITGAITETSTGSDSFSANIVFAANVADTGTGAETFSATAVFRSAISDSATAADTVQITGNVFNVVIQEAATESDSVSATKTLRVTVFNQALCNDGRVSTQKVLNPVILQAATASDSTSARNRLSSQVSEGGTGADTTRVASSIFRAPVVETSAVSDATSPAGSIYNAPITETVVITEELLAAFLWNLINDNQVPGWQNINNTQSTTWSLEQTDQSPDWNGIKTL